MAFELSSNLVDAAKGSNERIKGRSILQCFVQFFVDKILVNASQRDPPSLFIQGIEGQQPLFGGPFWPRIGASQIF